MGIPTFGFVLLQVLGTWFSTPDINSAPRNNRATLPVCLESRVGHTTTGIQTTLHYPRAPSLPGVASFLTPKSLPFSATSSSAYCSHGVPPSQNYIANTLDPGSNTNFAAFQLARPSAGASIQKLNSVTAMDPHKASRCFPAETTNMQNATLGLPISSNADALSNESSLLKASVNHPTSPPNFRPVGVLVKKSRPQRATFITPTTSLSRPRGPHSTYSHHYLGPTPAGPPWRATGVRGIRPANWIHPDYQNNLNAQFYQSCPNSLSYHKSYRYQNSHACPYTQAYTNDEGKLYMNEDTKIKPSLIQNTCQTQDNRIRHGDFTVPLSVRSAGRVLSNAEHDTKSDVKVDMNLEGIDEPVRDKVSVVTLLANDTSLCTTNHVGTTSLNEGEVSLHDAKMQLSEATTVPESRPTQQSVFTQPSTDEKAQPRAQPAPDEIGKAQPGLEMLSDVSILVESMSTGGKSSRESFSGNERSPDQPTSGGPDTVLCPPQATYVGTVRSNPDAFSVQTSLSNGLPGDEASYTELSSSVLQGEHCTVSEDLQYVGLLKEVYTTMSPEKASRSMGGFQTDQSSLQNAEVNQDIDRLIPKLPMITTKVTEDTPVRQGLPGSMVDGSQIPLSNVHDGAGTKRSRPKKSQQSSEKCSDCTSQPSQITKKMKKQHDKENVFEISHTRLQDMAASEFDEKNNQKANMQAAFAAKDSCSSFDKLHMDSPTQPSHENQHGCHTKMMITPASQQHATNVSTAGYYDWGLDESQNESAFVPAEAMNSSMESAVGTGAVSEYYDMINKQFDPLVIAEEEVTSTQPLDDTLQGDIKLQDNIKAETSRSKHRSHICVTCFNLTSSSDDSISSSPNRSSSYSSNCNSGKGNKTPKANQKRRSTGKTETCSLTCEICGRAFSSVSNLSRHKRLFHPSLFLTDAGIVELPLVPCRPMLPLSPSSITSVKSPSSTFNLSASATSVTGNQGKATDQTEGGHDLKKRKTKRKHSTQEDAFQHKAQQPKKKKIKNASEPRKKQKTVLCGESKTTSKVFLQRKRLLKRKDGKTRKAGSKRQTRASASDSRVMYKPSINFRTKKRTRINSTVCNV